MNPVGENRHAGRAPRATKAGGTGRREEAALAAAGRPGLVTRERALLALLVLLALGLRLYGIQAGLPEVFEEAYPFRRAWTMWGWGPTRGLDLNPHWFRYPSLVIDLQFLGQGLLYLILTVTGAVHSTVDFRVLLQLDATPFFLMGRSIIAVIGALTVLPVFHITRRIASRRAAIAAALLVVLSPPLIAKSQLIEVDVPLTFLVACGLLAALRLTEGLTRRRALVAGVAAGLAASAKYPGLLMFVPCLTAILLGARAATGPAWPERAVGARPIAWPAAVVLTGLALVAALFATSPFLFLDAKSALADLAVEGEHMRVGHFGAELGATWWVYVRDWFMTVADWPVAIASLAGLLWFGVRRSPWALVAGSFVLAYALLVSSFAMKADRYLLPLLPAAFVFASAFVDQLCMRLVRPGRWGTMAFAVAVAGLMASAVLAFPDQLARLRPDTRLAAREWLESRLTPGAFVASEPYGPSLLSPLDLQSVDRDLFPALRQRGWADKVYAVVSMPLFQVAPERSAVFYDPALYHIADVFIVTGSVRDRYRREPERFAAQLALYDTLETHWQRWVEFVPRGGPGPQIVIYRNPAQTQTFARRRPSPGPVVMLRDAPPSGGEAYFEYNVGLNYELCGFATPALQFYLSGIGRGDADPASVTVCAERAAGILVRGGRKADALELLDRVATALASHPALARRLREGRERLSAGDR